MMVYHVDFARENNRGESEEVKVRRALQPTCTQVIRGVSCLSQQHVCLSFMTKPVCNATHLWSERRGNIRVGLSESGQKVLNITGGRRWLQMSTNIATDPSPTAGNEFLIYIGTFV